MTYTWLQIKSHLTGLGHGSTLNKVRNLEELAERSAARFIAKCKPMEIMRTQPLSQVVHDDLFNYALPGDYHSMIDLMPEDNRNEWDMAFRRAAGRFDLQKAIKNRIVSIEGSEGSKIIRINWKSRAPQSFHTMDSLAGNGTWSAVGTASGVALDTIVKKVGSGSIKFDAAATNDGISNLNMSQAVDMTDADEVGELLFDLYIKNAADLANFNGITAIWGNDLTTKYWTGVEQTLQADGTALHVGFNTIKVPWNTATETGTVAPATIDSLKFTVNIDAAITDLRIDNVRMSIGRNFDIKYNSKCLYRTSAGVYATIPANDSDTVLVDTDSLPIYLFELLKDMAHQVEGTDAAFDINYAAAELKELYPSFLSEYPDQRKKLASNYGGKPRFRK